MQEPTPPPVPGFYRAQHAYGALRYWDGRLWRNDVAVPPGVQPGPLAPGAFNGGPPSRPLQPDQFGPPQPNNTSPAVRPKRTVWPWIVGGVVSVVLLAAMFSDMDAGSSGQDRELPVAAAASSSAKPSGGATPVAGAADEDKAAEADGTSDAKFATQTLTGSGDDVKLITIDQPVIVTFDCALCSSNTSLETNGPESLLVNEIGAYHGEHLLNSEQGSLTTQLTIGADSAWTLQIADVSTAHRFDGAASGHGDTVIAMTGTFDSATVTNTGDSNFTIENYGSDSWSPLALNVIGAYRGTIPLDGEAYMQIGSNGDWSITPQ